MWRCNMATMETKPMTHCPRCNARMFANALDETHCVMCGYYQDFNSAYPSLEPSSLMQSKQERDRTARGKSGYQLGKNVRETARPELGQLTQMVMLSHRRYIRGADTCGACGNISIKRMGHFVGHCRRHWKIEGAKHRYETHTVKLEIRYLPNTSYARTATTGKAARLMDIRCVEGDFQMPRDKNWIKKELGVAFKAATEMSLLGLRRWLEEQQ